MSRGGGREHGTWKCRACGKYNRPTMSKCRQCNAEKPAKRQPKSRRRSNKPKLQQRSEAAKRRERESGVGSNGLKKGMTEQEKRLARGRALRSSPIANKIERGMRQREAEARNGDGR